MNKTLAIVVIVAAMAAASAKAGLNVEYVGSLSEGLHSPTLVTVLNDGLAVMDPFSKELIIYSADGVVRTRVIVEGQASGLGRLDPAVFLFCDRMARTVTLVNVTTGEQRPFLTSADGLVDPSDLEIHGDTVWVLDAGNSTLSRFTRTGTLIDRIEILSAEGEPLDCASGFAVEAVSGAIYVVDQTTATVTAITGGDSTFTFASYGSGDDQLTRPGDIAVSTDGAVLLTDRYQGRVQVYDAAGNYVGGFSDLGSTSRSLATPIGLSLDRDGTVYVASAMNGSVEIFNGTFDAAMPKVIAASQQWPPDGAQVVRNDLALTVQATVGAEVTLRGFEFQLFGSDTTLGPVEQSALTPADSISVGIDPTVVGAAWSPTSDLSTAAPYFWRVRTVTTDTVGDWSALWSFSISVLPEAFRLDQNYPNPFNPSTEIRFSVPSAGDVRLTVYNLLGREVRVLVDERLDAGEHTAFWDGTTQTGASAATGVYFYRLEADGRRETKKMLLLK